MKKLARLFGQVFGFFKKFDNCDYGRLAHHQLLAYHQTLVYIFIICASFPF
jgi:hypothetical protein